MFDETNFGNSNVSDWQLFTMDVESESIMKEEIGGDLFWIHKLGSLQKDLKTMIGVPGCVTRHEENANFYEKVLRADAETVKWIRSGISSSCYSIN